MPNVPDSQTMDLEDFLASATQSFTDAQQSLLQGTGLSAKMMLSNAELEVKVAVENTKEGRMLVRPISLADMTAEKISPDMLSTVRINLVGSVSETAEKVEVETPAPSTPSAPGRVKIPDLSGLTLKEVSAKLKKGKWKFAAHALPRTEAAKAEAETHGKILRQKPDAGALGDKASDTLHFWVNLGSTPVKAIDGIGEKMEVNLSKIGIRSVGDLSLADSKKIFEFLNINEKRSREFVNMAEMMSRLTILGLKDEVVELLAKGARVNSVEALAKSSVSSLYTVCKKALASGKVMTPSAFSFTKDDVAAWINAAKNSK